MTLQEYRLLIEGMLLGALVLWCISGYIKGKNSKKEREILLNRMNKINTDETTNRKGKG